MKGPGDGLLMERLGTEVRMAALGAEDYDLSVVHGLGRVTVPFCTSVSSSEKWRLKKIPIPLRCSVRVIQGHMHVAFSTVAVT